MGSIEIGFFNTGEIPIPPPIFGEKFAYIDTQILNVGEFLRYGIQTGEKGVFLQSAPSNINCSVTVFINSTYTDNGEILSPFSYNQNLVIPESIVRKNPTIQNNGVKIYGMNFFSNVYENIFSKNAIYLPSNSKHLIEINNISSNTTILAKIVFSEKG